MPEVEKQSEEGGEQSKENEKKSEDVEKKHDSQVKWVLIFMGVLIISIFATSWIISESKEFEYAGVEWKKDTFGKIPIYRVKLTGESIYGDPINFQMVFRNDPRELDVPIEGEIKIAPGPIYFAMNL